MILSRRRFLSTAAGGVALGGLTRRIAAAALDSRTEMPTPTPLQLAWQDMEVGMFFHFDMRTYQPGWRFKDWTLPDANLYNPTKLDTDQWISAAKAIGAKYAVFVARHASGFLQWQSDCYPYGVRQTTWRDGKGDVVQEFVDSCHKSGILPGLYATVASNGYWEVSRGLVNRGEGGDPERQSNYARNCERMLAELWSRYGPLAEIWFDGGALSREEGGPDLIPLLKKYQPNAIVFQGPAASIRYVGNERGMADYPCWATVPSIEAAQTDKEMLDRGDPNGNVWLPAECDTTVRDRNWFWKPDGEEALRTLDELMDVYYKSVGRNCNLLLNANPDPDGLVPQADFQRYVEFGREIRRRFSVPLAETSGTGNLVELALKRPATIDHVTIMEDIACGERVRAYQIEGLVPGNTWKQLCEGISIGHKRIQQFEPVETSKVRLRLTASVAEPRIRSLSVFSCSTS